MTDPTGVSGTGPVADGVLWPDGSVTLRWRERPSTAVWDSLDLMLSVHGHDRATRAVFLDEAAPDAAPCAFLFPVELSPHQPPRQCIKRGPHKEHRAADGTSLWEMADLKLADPSSSVTIPRAPAQAPSIFDSFRDAVTHSAPTSDERRERYAAAIFNGPSYESVDAAMAVADEDGEGDRIQREHDGRYIKSLDAAHGRLREGYGRLQSAYTDLKTRYDVLGGDQEHDNATAENARLRAERDRKSMDLIAAEARVQQLEARGRELLAAHDRVSSIASEMDDDRVYVGRIVADRLRAAIRPGGQTEETDTEAELATTREAALARLGAEHAGLIDRIIRAGQRHGQAQRGCCACPHEMEV